MFVTYFGLYAVPIDNGVTKGASHSTSIETGCTVHIDKWLHD